MGVTLSDLRWELTSSYSVVMGLLYRKIYITSVLPLFANENESINHILTLYRLRTIIPADLGVDVCDLGLGEALELPIKTMSKLAPDCTTNDSVSPELIAALSWTEPIPYSSSTPDIGGLLTTLVEARTPLGCISIIREVIEQIVAVVESVKPGARVAPDDLLSLLAWVTIKSGVEDLESLVYYIKTFRLSDSLAAEFE